MWWHRDRVQPQSVRQSRKLRGLPCASLWGNSLGLEDICNGSGKHRTPLACGERRWGSRNEAGCGHTLRGYRNYRGYCLEGCACVEHPSNIRSVRVVAHRGHEISRENEDKPRAAEEHRPPWRSVPAENVYCTLRDSS